jgi:tungstate transport system ATP-binding protein
MVATDPALIELRQAGVRFDAMEALSDMNLTVSRGERIALVGANGSGKTTLLRVLHGLQPLSAGQRKTSGTEPTQAMVFQRPFMLRMSARHTLARALKLTRVPRAQWDTRCAEALQRVGLATQADQTATELSGGQQQRLALARAWALNPQVLLLDEPTASLDPSAKREIETLVHDFADTGAALVMASHNLGQVKRLSRRVIYLERGRVLADVSTDQFFNGDVPPEAAHFLRGELPW